MPGRVGNSSLPGLEAHYGRGLDGYLKSYLASCLVFPLSVFPAFLALHGGENYPGFLGFTLDLPISFFSSGWGVNHSVMGYDSGQ